MNKYRGTAEELEAVIGNLGYNGTWTDIDNGRQFRCDNGTILNWYSSTGTLQYQSSREARQAKELFQSAVTEVLFSGSESTGPGVDQAVTPHTPPVAGPSINGTDGAEREKIFVVHGHDNIAREQLERILLLLGLDPFVLANTGGGGLTIIEALENEIRPNANRIRFGIVLMTPDDVGYSIEEGAEKAEPRARQNVVMEMGMLIAAIGRPHVAILKKGHLEVPSDANGIIYIPFNNHVKETVPRLCDRFRHAGFDLGSDRITRAST